MRANKHLLLWSSLATLAVLAWAAFTELALADWRRAQRAVAARLPASAELPLQLRQIVVPALKVTDRCTSCHVGMAPGEAGLEGDPVYGRHPAVYHEPAQLGCTTCHGGQGRATSKEDAHGNVPHWPEPMIPRRYAYAGCGACHTHLAVPNLSQKARGLALLERNDCLACHRIDQRGGTQRPGGAGGFEGPDLSSVGARGFRADWYEHHLAAGEQSVPALGPPPWKAAFGALAEDDRREIENYLASLVGAPALVEAKALFHSLGCRGCHKVHGVGGDDGPDLSREGQKDPAQTSFSGVRGPHTIANWLGEHFRSPARVVPGSQMPEMALSEAQIDLLTLYLFSLRSTEAPEAFWPRDRVRALRLGEREFASDGATLYGAFCAACHGRGGQGMRYAGMAPFPAVANADFLAIAPDELLLGTLNKGRPGRRMPAWGEKEGGLRPDEIRELIRYLRTLAGVAAPEPDPHPKRWVRGDRAQGARLYTANCAGCHGDRGQGGEGVALNSPVLLAAATDTYLYETIRRGRRGTSMLGFDQPSSVRRALAPDEIESIVAHLRSWQSSENKP